MNVKPLGDKLLLKRAEADEKTAGGILLPDTAKEKPKKGNVIALGTGKIAKNGKNVGFLVKVGDKVFFSSYAGNEIKIKGEEYLLISEEDILAIID